MLIKKSKPSRLDLNIIYIIYIFVFHLLFYYIYHLLKKPYRQDIPAIQYELPRSSKQQRKWIGALYDAMFNILLESYEQLTDLKLTPATGQMVFLLIELTRRLDEYLDRGAEHKCSVDMNEVLKSPLVHEQLTIFCRYLELFRQTEPILAYLKELFMEYYDRYIHAFVTTRTAPEFETILATGHIDTGVWLQSVMKIVALFNNHTPADEVLYNFYLFGIIGKLSDDMLDIVYDVKKGNPNLLYALLCSNESELAAFQLATKKYEHLGIGWWHKHCPQTYQRYFEYINSYYKQIYSSKLRMACHLMFVPSVIAYDVDAARSKNHS